VKAATPKTRHQLLGVVLFSTVYGGRAGKRRRQRLKNELQWKLFKPPATQTVFPQRAGPFHTPRASRPTNRWAGSKLAPDWQLSGTIAAGDNYYLVAGRVPQVPAER